MEFRTVHNLKEICQHDLIQFNVKGNQDVFIRRWHSMLLRASETNLLPISSHIWVTSTTLRPRKKNRKKVKYIFMKMTILGLAESFKQEIDFFLVKK